MSVPTPVASWESLVESAWTKDRQLSPDTLLPNPGHCDKATRWLVSAISNMQPELAVAHKGGIDDELHVAVYVKAEDAEWRDTVDELVAAKATAFSPEGIVPPQHATSLSVRTEPNA